MENNGLTNISQVQGSAPSSQVKRTLATEQNEQNKQENLKTSNSLETYLQKNPAYEVSLVANSNQESRIDPTKKDQYAKIAEFATAMEAVSIADRAKLSMDGITPLNGGNGGNAGPASITTLSPAINAVDYGLNVDQSLLNQDAYGTTNVNNQPSSTAGGASDFGRAPIMTSNGTVNAVDYGVNVNQSLLNQDAYGTTNVNNQPGSTAGGASDFSRAPTRTGNGTVNAVDYGVNVNQSLLNQNAYGNANIGANNNLNSLATETTESTAATRTRSISDESTIAPQALNAEGVFANVNAFVNQNNNNNPQSQQQMQQQNTNTSNRNQQNESSIKGPSTVAFQ